MRVEFSNVGAQRMTWVAEVSEISHDALLRAVCSKGALGSRDVEFWAEADGRGGKVIVGGMRPVGEWRCVLRVCAEVLEVR